MVVSCDLCLANCETRAMWFLFCFDGTGGWTEMGGLLRDGYGTIGRYPYFWDLLRTGIGVWQ